MRSDLVAHRTTKKVPAAKKRRKAAPKKTTKKGPSKSAKKAPKKAAKKEICCGKEENPAKRKKGEAWLTKSLISVLPQHCVNGPP